MDEFGLFYCFTQAKFDCQVINDLINCQTTSISLRPSFNHLNLKIHSYHPKYTHFFTMYRSHQPSFVYQNTKPISQCIQESEYVIEDNQSLSQTNKENFSYQLNKSNFSQHNPMNKSNRSHVSMGKSGMMASKSQSFIMAESKARNLIDSHHSKISQRSIMKNYNTKMGPALKVLTESDLTENDQHENHIFSDSEPEPTAYQNRIDYSQNINRVMASHSAYENSMAKSTQSLRRKVNAGLQNERQNKPQRNMQKRQQRVQQISEPQYDESEQQSISIPDFTHIPNQKLQIRHYTPLNRQRVSFSELISLLPHNLNALKKVKRLSIINCCINSLQGIQNFQCLQEVNLRKNELREVEELYRIKNKQNVHLINIVGNDIEHYHLARYRALSQVFTNLQELNDKNYAMLKRKEHGNMKKVIQKSSKLEYELRKTLKKQMRQTDRAIFKLNPLTVSDQQETQRNNRSNQKTYRQISDHRATQKDEYSYQNEGGNSHRHYNSSVSRRSTSEVKSPTNAQRRRNEIDEDNEVYEVQQSGINPHSYSLGESSKEKSFCKSTAQNHNVATQNRPELRQVSLGNIENVPITKSIKCQQKSPSKFNNKNNRKNQQDKQNQNINNKNRTEIPLQTVPITKNLLEIKTEDLDDESDLAGHLHQPTATFAMQKERQQQCSLQNKQFMFRNKKPNSQFSINTNTTNTQNTNPRGSKNRKQPKDQSQIFEEYQNDSDSNQMSLSRISRISEIPTKRLSNNRRSMTSQYPKAQQRSKHYENYDNTSEQSFMNGNELYPNQNTTYMAMSQISQWRPNESMDDDCLLKDKKDSLEEEKLVIATAVYMQNLLKKTLQALTIEGTKRKNMPKKRTFF